MNHTLSRMKLLLKEVMQEIMKTNANSNSEPSKNHPPSNTLYITGFFLFAHNLQSHFCGTKLIDRVINTYQE